MKTYPQLRELQSCIREFREIYERKSMPLLYIFIDRYKKSGLKELSRFAEGLEKILMLSKIPLPVHYQTDLLRGQTAS